MARIDPKTGEPINDDPDQNSELDRGGRKEGDPGLKGASATGGGDISEM